MPGEDECEFGNEGNGNGVCFVKKCLYCDRKNCDDCPMPFDDKVTLKDFLSSHSITIKESPFIFNDEHQIQSTDSPNPSQQKSRNTIRNRN